MAIVFIGIGSNLGDKQKNCKKAIKLISQDGLTKSLVKSKWYETEALLPEAKVPMAPPTSIRYLQEGPICKCPTLVKEGDKSPKFINGVVRIETDLSPRALLAILQKIEIKLGRIRTGKKWEPRTIDLDILFYDSRIINTPALKVPHPELHKRIFVLEPLCDIAPNLVHPVFKKTIIDIVRACRER